MQHRPCQGPGHGVADGPKRGGQTGQGVIVRPHDGVGEVLVVDQDDVGCGQPHRLRDLDLLGLHGHRQTMGAHQRAVLVQGVQADDERVRAQHRFPGGRVGALLAKSQRDDPSTVHDHLVGEDGGTRGVQPGPGPALHVSA